MESNLALDTTLTPLSPPNSRARAHVPTSNRFAALLDDEEEEGAPLVPATIAGAPRRAVEAAVASPGQWSTLHAGADAFVPAQRERKRATLATQPTALDAGAAAFSPAGTAPPAPLTASAPEFTPAAPRTMTRRAALRVASFGGDL